MMPSAMSIVDDASSAAPAYAQRERRRRPSRHSRSRGSRTALPSPQGQQERESRSEPARQRERDEVLAWPRPRREFDQQEPDAADSVQGEQHDQQPFARLEERL